jgi:hypothetical protein
MCAIGLSAVPAAATYRASGFVPWHMAEYSSGGGMSVAGQSRRAAADEGFGL